MKVELIKNIGFSPLFWCYITHELFHVWNLESVEGIIYEVWWFGNLMLLLVVVII